MLVLRSADSTLILVADEQKLQGFLTQQFLGIHSENNFFIVLSVRVRFSVLDFLIQHLIEVVS